MSPEAEPRRNGGWPVPREHGAYAQLLLPMAVAWASGQPSWAAAGLSIAAAAAFLAHEPLLVLLGGRGARARREARGVIAQLVLLAVIATTAAALGAWTGGPTVALVSAVPLTLGITVVVLTICDRERSALGESLAATALSGCALPVAIAGGVAADVAAVTWAAWATGLTASTGAVRWVLAKHKKRRDPAAIVVIVLATSSMVAGAVLASPAWSAAAPLVVWAWAIAIARPHPMHLRRIGWSLVAACLLCAAWLVWVARRAP